VFLTSIDPFDSREESDPAESCLAEIRLVEGRFTEGRIAVLERLRDEHSGNAVTSRSFSTSTSSIVNVVLMWESRFPIRKRDGSMPTLASWLLQWDPCRGVGQFE
jgi:hypothetical protein